MKKLTTEQIKKDSAKAVKDMHTPKGWSDEAWEAAKRACRQAIDEYELNTVRNKVDIQKTLKEAEKAVERK